MNIDEANKKSFGENLKEQRSKKYKTQKEFADILGIPATTYGQYETGRREPDLKTVVLLAELLGVSTDCLLTTNDIEPHLNFVREIIRNNVLLYETLKDNSDSDGSWEIFTPYGMVTITKDKYKKIIEDAKSSFEDYIKNAIENELYTLRSQLYKQNDFSKIEAKMLCDSLGYDFEKVKYISAKSFDAEQVYEGTVYITYFLYFTNISNILDDDEGKLLEKYLWYKALVDSDIFHFDLSKRNQFEFMLNNNRNSQMPSEIQAWKKLDKYCPENISPLVKEFLRQHWELSEEEMNMPFRKMRYIFFRYGLVKFEGNIDREAEAKDFLFWRGSRKD